MNTRKVVQSEHGSVIAWQDVPRAKTGGVLVGDIPETILPLVIERLREINEPPNTPSRETALAIEGLELAMYWLEARRRDRDSRGVTGTFER